MPVVKANQAQTFELPGVTFKALASPSRGSTELSAWQVSIAPGTLGDLHSVTREEVFVATGGAAVVTLDGVEQALSDGEALIVPAGVAFGLSNPHREIFTAVVAFPVGGQAVTSHGTFTPPWAE